MWQRAGAKGHSEISLIDERDAYRTATQYCLRLLLQPLSQMCRILLNGCLRLFSPGNSKRVFCFRSTERI